MHNFISFIFFITILSVCYGFQLSHLRNCLITKKSSRSDGAVKNKTLNLFPNADVVSNLVNLKGKFML